MNRAIILHGMPSKEEYYNITNADSPSNSHWIAWLQHQLCMQDIVAQTPEIPQPYKPDYDIWKNEFEKLVPNDNTLLVGHSCGGGFLIRWLSENPQNIVGKVVLVAPWLDIEKKAGPMFDFSINKDIALQSKKGIDLLYSTNDGPELQSSLEFIRQNTKDFRYHEFVGYGHFNFSSMKTRQFPELLQICLAE